MALGLTVRGRVLWRLLGLQAAWSYERMQGVGFGHAVEPLLRDLFRDQPDRYRAALARAAGFYNANPYLAAAAVGAEARAEAEAVEAPQIERLRTALSGPLGALGDRLFWTGLVPAMVSALVVAVAWGAGVAAVITLLVVHNAVRLAMGAWLLELGWRHGLRVGAALQQSGLARASTVATHAAAGIGAAALPVAGSWLLMGVSRTELIGVGAFVAGAMILGWLFWPRVTAVTLTLAAGAGVLLWQWGFM
jgi:mannose/fructose/N-acetylgalactosamine-specific phosphotransferase system component IID